MLSTRIGGGSHVQGAEFFLLRVFDAFEQVVFVVGVKQKPNRAAIHAVDRHVTFHVAVNGFEHKAISAKRDYNVRFVC